MSQKLISRIITIIGLIILLKGLSDAQIPGLEASKKLFTIFTGLSIGLIGGIWHVYAVSKEKSEMGSGLEIINKIKKK